MRTVAAITVFVVLAGVSCAGRTGPQASAATVKWPTEATATLTEDELVQLVKALPALKAALREASWKHPVPQEDESQINTLPRLVESMEIPGVVESLKAAGGWAKLRLTLYKVFAATAALVIDRAPPELIERLRQDTTAGGRRSLANYEYFKNACTQIPEGNKQLVAKYQGELQPLGSLGR